VSFVSFFYSFFSSKNYQKFSYNTNSLGHKFVNPFSDEDEFNNSFKNQLKYQFNNQNNSQYQSPYQNQNFQQNSTNFNQFYQPKSSGAGFFSIIEIAISLFTIIALASFVFFGFYRQDTINRDKARLNDINQAMLALENFYKNSSLDPDNRQYPKATCSARLNEVDFESSLRLALTGKRPDLDPHAYILPENFPRDKAGKYSLSVTERLLDYRCPQGLSSIKTDPIYADKWPSCNFNQTNGPKNCYLYTSSTNGDTYEIAYFSESDNAFFAFKRFRDQGVVTRIVPSN